MKNTIWVGRTSHSGRKSYCYSDTKPRTDSNDPTVKHNISDSGWWYITADIYGTGVEQNELAEVIIDTERQIFMVKRERKKGWYLALTFGGDAPEPFWWDGTSFTRYSNIISNDWKETNFRWIDETPLTSPFLKEME